MKILIAEDDMVSRNFLYRFLSAYGDCDMVVDGLETLDAFLLATKEGDPYDLICLDLMMPKVNGIQALRGIRELESRQAVSEDKKVKIILTTGLAETRMVREAFEIG